MYEWLQFIILFRIPENFVNLLYQIFIFFPNNYRLLLETKSQSKRVNRLHIIEEDKKINTNSKRKET